MERPRVVVIGAGVTGLSCARRLEAAGCEVELLERASTVGGVVRSRHIDGVGWIDLGPQSLRTGDIDLLDEIEAIGIEDDRLVAGSAAGARYLYRDGELVALPHGPGDFVRSDVLPWGAKLRMFLEPFRKAERGDQSVRDFFAHRLGTEVADRLVDPFVSGVYAGDPTRLSMRAVFPSLKAGVEEHGSLLRWGLSKAKEAKRARKEGTAKPKRKPELFSFREGLGQWTRAMADSLEGRVRTGVTVESVRRTEDGWRVSLRNDPIPVDADAVVLAVPAGVAGALCGPNHAAPARALADIPYAPVSTVHLAYRRDQVAHPLDGFGYLIPSNQNRPVLGILWISSLFPDRVEEDRVLTTTFVGGARQASNALLPEHRLIEIAHREHARALGVHGAPLHAEVETHHAGIAQYEFGHVERVAAAEAIEAVEDGLVLAGSWRKGVSLADCWTCGREAADRVVAGLPAVRLQSVN